MTYIEKARQSAEKLDELHRIWKSFHGRRWEERYQELAVPMEEAMRREGITNPISFVIPIARRMQARGEDPGMWFAVAVEMAFRIKAKEAS